VSESFSSRENLEISEKGALSAESYSVAVLQSKNSAAVLRSCGAAVKRKRSRLDARDKKVKAQISNPKKPITNHGHATRNLSEGTMAGRPDHIPP
jgi:hypothetical protein